VRASKQKSLASHSVFLDNFRSEIEATAGQFVTAHDRHLGELENELGDRLWEMLDEYRDLAGEDFHPQVLMDRPEISV
jgi:hypothetical protein